VFVPPADELEQQIGMAVGVGQVSNLVDDQQAGANAPEPRLAPAPVPQPEPSRAENAQGSDIFAKIERLADLHQKGTLSPEEFATKKAELLSRL
jgi:hypothetical protein